MARTKQTARRNAPSSSVTIRLPTLCRHIAPVQAGKIIVVNESSQTVDFSLGVRLDTGIDNGKRFVSHYESHLTIRAKTTLVVPLRANVDPISLKTWILGFFTYGVVWHGNTDPAPTTTLENGNWDLEVTPGRSYTLVNDPLAKNLTRDEFRVIDVAFLQCLQRGDCYSRLWSNIRDRLPHDCLPRHTALQVRGEYENYNRHHHTIVLPYFWRSENRYPSVELTAGPNRAWITRADLDKALAPGGRARIDVYWRALDRQPGGNADVHTVCYTFDCATKTVSVRTAQNCDGTLTRSEYRPDNLSDIVKSANTNGLFLTFLSALRALGPGDSECTILDAISASTEEYDTTWSSHEIVVFLPKPWSTDVHDQFPELFQMATRQFLLANLRNEACHIRLPLDVVHNILQFAAPSEFVPVSRLHQRCVFGPQWISYSAAHALHPEIPPTEVQQCVLSATEDLVGMGRVNTWTDAGDGAASCLAAEDLKLETVMDDSFAMYTSGFTHPFYFDFPARNVAGGQINGTSASWT